MNIDKKIKEQLTTEAEQVDKILLHQEGIFSMLFNAYKGSLGRWMIIVSVVAVLVSLLIIWAGYQFFFVDLAIKEQLHWAVVLIISLIMQVALKMWAFMEMNRNSMLRELKRIEVAINQK